MLLPPELLTLVFLNGLTAVHAQVENITAPTYITSLDTSAVVTTPPAAPLSPTGDFNDIGAPAPTPTTDEPPQFTEVEACDLPDPPDWCNEPPPDFWHPEESATGWDDWASWNNDNIGGGGGNNIAPPTTSLKPAEQTPDVITTVTPTVIAIRTSVEPTLLPPVQGGATLSPQGPGTVPAGGGHSEVRPPAQQSPGQDGLQTEGVQGSSIPQGGRVPENTVQPTPGPAVPGSPAPAAPVAPAPVAPTPVAPTPGVSAPGVPAPGQSPAGSKPNAEYVPAQGQSGSTGNALLDTIISHLSSARPGAQPAQPAQSTQPSLQSSRGAGEGFTQESAAAPTDTARVGPGESAQGWEAASGTATQGPADSVASQESIAVGNTITLGSATISLTAGLSTIVGTGTDTTLIAIQTDSASHTLITISSSGTAITATITNAPATVTLPRTGFEASITNSAGGGAYSSRVAVTAVSTSSKGAANDRKVHVSSLSGLLLGMLGWTAML